MTATVGFIGTGNMGAALARAVCKTVPPQQVLLANRTPAKAEALAEELGCAAGTNEEVARACRLIFLGVKPQVMGEMLASLTPVLKEREACVVLVTMAAGLTCARIREMAGVDCLEWKYMDGDGDFRSKEVTELRNEADFIITNPPFSLFREFLAWIVEAGKKFAVIGNMNAITYKEVFPLIKDNKVWLGATGNGNDMVFGVPDGAKVDEKDKAKAARLGYVGNYTRLGNSCWFTSIEHGRRHEPLPLMSMADNLRFSKHKELKGKAAYDRYDNYDAIEVPFTDAIPSDYDGVMGVPISFLIKYCPEQFEILGITKTWYGSASKVYPEQIQVDRHGKETKVTKLNDGAVLLHSEVPQNETYYMVDGKYYTQVYARVLIKHIRS